MVRAYTIHISYLSDALGGAGGEQMRIQLSNLGILVIGFLAFSACSSNSLESARTPASPNPSPLQGTSSADDESCASAARNVKTHGAVGDGQNDDTLAIQAAIDAIDARGGTVCIPRGTYRITAPIAIGNGHIDNGFAYTSTVNNIRLIGGRTGGAYYPENPNAATVTLLWDGPFQKSMVQVNGPINGVEIKGLRLQADYKSDTGLQMTWARMSRVQDLAVIHPRSYGVALNMWKTNGIIRLPGARGNHFEEISVELGSYPDNKTDNGYQVGISLDGDEASFSDWHGMMFLNSYVQFMGDGIRDSKQVGMALRLTDSNSFHEIDLICGTNPCSGTGLLFMPVKLADGGMYPANNIFYGVSVGRGGIRRAVSNASEFSSWPKNFFFPMTTNDGENIDIDASPLVFGITDHMEFMSGRPLDPSLTVDTPKAPSCGNRGHLSAAVCYFN